MSLARWIVVVGTCGVSLGAAAGMAACSSSSNNGSSGGGNDAGNTGHDSATAGDTSSAGDGGTGGDTSATGDSGGGEASCETPPSLFSQSAPGVYCPGSGVDGGSAINCAGGQHCCEYPLSASTPASCVAGGTSCPSAATIDWQCSDVIDCTSLDAGTPVCCGSGTKTPVTSCSNTWPEWTGFTGTKCMASCPSGSGFTLCQSSTECGDAGPCTPSKSSGGDFGVCGP